jgi:tRNA G46 methylase TrmB
VFINFPEPPVWEGSKWRLLDAELFATVHKVLSSGGMLHILTDDEALCKYAFLLKKMRDLEVLPALPR